MFCRTNPVVQQDWRAVLLLFACHFNELTEEDFERW